MIKKKYFPVLFIFLGFFVLSLIFIAVIFLTNKSDSFRFLLILLSLVTLVSLSLCAFFFTRYTIESISANNLRKENKYNLGEASFFYNMDYFTTGCTQMKKAKRNKKHLQHFIVAFSASERRIVQNSDRNQNVTRLDRKSVV